MAAAAGTQCCLLEDGFLRSVGLGVDEPALSLLFDHQGIYYDAGCPSWLEHLVAQPLDVAAIARTQSLISLWRRHRVSKYNHLPEFDGPLPARYVLLADQTFGDASLRYGQASAQDFTAMLESALQQHVDCSVLIKVHPDVFAGHKTGHFDLASLQNHPRVTILADNVHPVRLIEQAQAVYTVTSQIGFEALLWDTPVFTFGMPFYAGYGLTTDAKVAPARRQRASREQLVHAALVRYARYLDPETGALCEPERLIEWMGLQRRMRHRFAAPVYAPNFSRWKKPIVQRFFQGAEVQFLEKASDFPGEVDAESVLKPCRHRRTAILDTFAQSPHPSFRPSEENTIRRCPFGHAARTHRSPAGDSRAPRPENAVARTDAWLGYRPADRADVERNPGS